MVDIADDPDKGRGLYPKYQVRKIDQDNDTYSPPLRHCFVLNYAIDPHARVALATYADSCEADYPLLAKDLRLALIGTRPI